MKKIFLVIFLILITFPSRVGAHSLNQPPYFKINGTYTGFYPVTQTSTKDFFIPQDISVDNFVVGDEINFELDSAQLPIIPQVLNQAVFEWDFGDGTKGEGLKNSHKFEKAGSYFLDVYIKIGNDLPQLLQSTLIQVLPNKDYKLPKAVIEVNGEDKSAGVAVVNFDKNIKIDGSKSQAGTGKIKEYFWDLGDGNTSTEKSFSRKYPENYFYYPVLRVKDENGFISDATVTLTKDSKLAVVATNSTRNSIFFKVVVGIFILLIIYTVVLIFKRFIKK